MMRIYLWSLFVSLTLAVQQTNILFLIFDDLRPELGAYGRSHMITPHIDRLASKSVIFDKAIAQIAVCNPSRDSLLTGLRPDTVGTYSFQSSFRPHLTFSTRFGRMGYNTAGSGKIAHWETDDKEIWNFDSFENGWYDYQNKERNHMNSSTMPDKITPEEQFRDYEYTSRTIKAIRDMAAKPNYFMAAVGFKLPHLAVHMPYKYYEMYKDKAASWRLSKKELRFPYSVPDVSYRCCAEENFIFMKDEGATKSDNAVPIWDINAVFTEAMHDELMMGYCGAITFVDKQVGRILALLDELNLWNNITIVLTADHGMHNGEKGIWEKWSMFDEATRIPLIIYHPQTPFPGQHYTSPVELIDIFPTLNDIVGAPYDASQICRGEVKCLPLQGKSLAPAVLGMNWQSLPSNEQSSKKYTRKDTATKVNWFTSMLGRKLLDENNNSSSSSGSNSSNNISGRSSNSDSRSRISRINTSSRGETEDTIEGRSLRGIVKTRKHESWHGIAQLSAWILPASNSSIDSMPIFPSSVAITQSWRCADKQTVMNARNNSQPIPKGGVRPNIRWNDCDRTVNPPNEISVMGYSMRSDSYRYTAYFYYNRVSCMPMLDVAPFAEELYDHRGETLADFTHLETTNIAVKNPQTVAPTLALLRDRLLTLIRTQFVFRGCFKD